MQTITNIEFEIEGLERLKEKTDEYKSELFDWLSSLGHTHLLSHFYDLECDIDIRLVRFKHELEELKKLEEQREVEEDEKK